MKTICMKCGYLVLQVGGITQMLLPTWDPQNGILAIATIRNLREATSVKTELLDMRPVTEFYQFGTFTYIMYAF